MTTHVAGAGKVFESKRLNCISKLELKLELELRLEERLFLPIDYLCLHILCVCTHAIQ